ncbi:MAG: MFS transporter, partial [Comamonadaceae bacterium]
DAQREPHLLSLERAQFAQRAGACGSRQVGHVAANHHHRHQRDHADEDKGRAPAPVLTHPRRDVPDLPAAAGASPLRELGALKRKQVWLTLGIGAIGFGGMFSVYSYIKPTLIEVSGLSVGHVPAVLALFGVGMVAGNIVGARLADKALMPTIGWLLVYSLVLLLAFVPAAQHWGTAALAVFFIGTMVAIGPALQIRLMDVAGDAQTLAAALNHSAFNAANALGAWLGGVSIAAGLGWTSTGWVGALLALAGLGIFGWAVADARRIGQR